MKRLLLSGGLLLVLAGAAAAQPRFNPIQPVQPSTSPALSPYLNLLRGGNRAANYYLGVVPEQQRRSNEAMFGRTINQGLIPRVEALQNQPTVEEELARIGTSQIPAGFGRVPPPDRFSRTIPGYGSPLPMPPPLMAPPPPEPKNTPGDKPMEKLDKPANQ